MTNLILSVIVFLFPLFFLPITQEYFTTSKFYLLAFGALALIFSSITQIFVKKKITWHKKPFDTLFILLVITCGISILIVSPNKIQALVNPNFGLAAMVSLVIFYFYMSRSRLDVFKILKGSSMALAFVSILFFFQPFKNLNLSPYLQFLKSQNFNLIGNQLDLIIFFAFIIVVSVLHLIKKSVKSERTFDYLTLGLNSVALILALITIVSPGNQLIMPPFRLSWYSAIEILKSPLTAFFGVGVDNYSSIFTIVKDVAYNQSSLWQISAFSVSRSTLLHILTENGLFGLVALSLLLFQMVKTSIDKKNLSIVLTGFMLIAILFFPASLIVFFLLVMVLGELASEHSDHPRNFDLGDLPPVYVGLTIAGLLVVGLAGYALGRAYISEYYFKESLNGYIKNSARDVYENQRRAILLNPYIERFRTSFSQTNLLIANNIAAKYTAADKQGQITDQEKQTIAQAVQAAISEAKAVVALNSNKNTNWENLAMIYRNILGVAQGADVWTVSSYLRAIKVDPQNPAYRLNLGGVYYTFKNYDEAVKLFEQAVSLKANWPNAYYNLAWALYQKQDYQRAVNAMQNALALIDSKNNRTDFEKASKDLEEFKKKVPQTEGNESTQEAQIKQSSQLSLPTPAPSLEPKIKLPNTASPEAK
jgi:tetratricopeptide (TPR) repeat protein